MKKIFTVLCLLLPFHLLYAQAEWQWGKRGGSPYNGSGGANAYEKVIDMATDPNGNVYILANNPGPANVDGQPGIGTADRLVIASWDCDGAFRWKKVFGSGASCIGNALKTDSLGGVYITGKISSTTALNGPGYFDADTVLPITNKTTYLIKYDTTGDFLWLKMPQPDTISALGTARYGFFDMDVSPSGNLFLFSCLLPGLYDDGAFVITEKDFYIVEYDKDGLFLNYKNIDIAITDGGNPNSQNGLTNIEQANFSRDHQNKRFYLYGSYDGNYGMLTFGNVNINAVGASFPMYLSAFDENGSHLWAKQSTDSAAIYVRDCRPVFDGESNIYIGGDAFPMSDNMFEGYPFINPLSFGNVSFVMKMDTSGNLIKGTSSVGGLSFSGSIAYANHRVYLSGKYYKEFYWGEKELLNMVNSTSGSNLFLAAFNAHTLDVIALDSLTATAGSSNNAQSITIDRNNNVYIGGVFEEQLFVADNTLTNMGGKYDWFVAKFGTDNCDCDIPQPDFSATNSGDRTLVFSYTGTAPYTGISWDFGDGSVADASENPSHQYGEEGSYTVCVTVTNDCGSNTHCQTVPTSGTSIPKIQGMPHLSVYPNPATATIHIAHAGKGTRLEIYNALGNRVYGSTLSQEKEQIDVSAFAAGMYLMKFKTAAGQAGTVKFVKN